jgi:hypothetical protein
MMMVGVAPVADALGRVNKLQVMPLEELGRPRVDVVVNCSGVFRDLFVNQMNLLDRAIKMAAEQDEPEEMNFVRKHAREQARPDPDPDPDPPTSPGERPPAAGDGARPGGALILLHRALRPASAAVCKRHLLHEGQPCAERQKQDNTLHRMGAGAGA